MKQAVLVAFFAVLMGGAPISELTAQNNSVLHLKSGDVALESNIKQIQESDLMAAKHGAFYYVLVHFTAIPTNSIKDKLATKGVTLVEYLPSFTYLSKIAVGTNIAELDKFKVDGVYLISPEFKMSYQVANQDFPEHALKGNQVLLVVQNQENGSVTLMDAVYQNYGAKIVSHYEYSHLTTLSISINQVRNLASHPMVKYMETIAPEAVPEDIVGQSNHRTNYISNPTVNAVPYNGAGVWIAIGDDGELGPHIDYTGRMDQSSVGPSGGNHGDHVSGIMMGAGNVDPDGRGMAWGADIKVYDVWDAVNSTPTSYVNPGVVVTSTSYGNGCNAGYTSFAQTADQQVRMMPNLMHVFSAGNSGFSNCNYGAGSGWGNITGGIKAGKNVLAVGNVTYTDALSGSSSRGPASDGRIKPDICANGTSVYSCFPNNQYVNNSGTSMAAPGVSGAYGALVHAYRELNNGTTPPSALVKGTMLNTADDLGNIGPDFKYGWGRLNARKVVQVFENNTYFTGSMAQGGAAQHNVVVPANVKQVKIMVYWNDYEGSTSSTLALVNNLDMTVTNPMAAVLMPYILDSSPNSTSLNTPATNGVDNLNNMEQVVIDNPIAGTYVINVAGTVVPQGPQTYYVIYEFITEDIIVTYPIGGEGFESGTTETIRWDAAKGTNSFKVEYSTDNGITWSMISPTVSATSRYVNFTVPMVVTGKALIKVTRNGISGQSIQPFSMIGVPSNIQVTSSCPASFELTWNAVTGATSYEVSVLGAKYMDSVITVNTTSATINGFSSNQSQWISVKAKTTDAIGKRAFAIKKQPGIWNCQLPNDVEVELMSPLGNVLFNCEDLSNTLVKVKLVNQGTQPVTNIDLTYKFNAAIVSESYTGVLNPGDIVFYTFNQALNIPSIQTNHDFIVWKDLPDDNVLNDTVHNPFRVVNGTSKTLPYIENFESFNRCATTNNCGGTVCSLAQGWVNAVNGTDDDIDFRINSGFTPSSGTGPNMDYSPGTSSGKYLYLEASGGCEAMTANLYTPCFDLSQTVNPVATIWYHMNGTNMGDLLFDVYANKQWHLNIVPMISGTQGNTWKEVTIDLGAFVGAENVIIRFNGITGNGWSSDIALDYFTIQEMGVGIIADSLPCLANGAVTITNSNITAGTNYVWNFGTGANPATANTVGPHSVTYSSLGVKNIQLSVTVNGSVQQSTKSINLVAFPTASFSSSFDSSTGKTSFTNSSSDHASSSWNFGDGGTSTLENPTHTYSVSGQYSVTLTTTNDCGSTNVIKSVVSGPLGIENGYANIGEVSVFPNPSSGSVTVKITGLTDQTGELKIFDIKGSLVLSQEITTVNNSATIELNLASLSKGVYVVDFKANQLSEKIRLVIQ